jgi:hypothetical protein
MGLKCHEGKARYPKESQPVKRGTSQPWMAWIWSPGNRAPERCDGLSSFNQCLQVTSTDMFFQFWANTGILIADDFQIYLERLNFPHTLCIPQQPYSQFFFFPFFSISSVIRSPSSAVRSGPILGIAPLLASICVVTCSQEPATMRHFWNYLSCWPSSIKLKTNATAPPFLAFYAHT